MKGKKRIRPEQVISRLYSYGFKASFIQELTGKKKGIRQLYGIAKSRKLI